MNASSAVKLEPDRISLSGRPEFLRPSKPTQTSAIAPAARKCSSCDVADNVQLMEGEPVHSVTIELKFIEAANEEVAKQKITPFLKTRGWKYRFHVGRYAMERDICRACLIGHREIEKEFRHKKSAELDSNLNSESYYAAISGE